MKNLPKIIDNDRKELLETLKGIAPEYDTLSIATGYWDIEGTYLILDAIKDYKKIRLLIGREPLLKRDNKSNVESPEPDYPDQDFFDDLQSISPAPEMRETVFKIKELIDNGQLEVRVYRKSFLHAKCYIFGNYETPEAVGIIGSSNFTRNGMTKNAELNALESDVRVVTYKPSSKDQEVGHLFWFDNMWNDEKTEPWEGKFIELLRTSPHGDLLYSPRDMYLRSLHELYKHELELDKEDIIQTQSKTLYQFQEKNVKNLRRILDQYGVAMLADSVGLGKTISAIGVMKQYRNQRIVVIAPKSLTGQWAQELAQEGLHNVRIVSLQNKHEIEEQTKIDKYSGVALFVIDESHNLRSHNGTRYEILDDWISSAHNEEAHVLLCTATPINNSLTDLTSQILLGARGDQDIFTLAVKTYDGQIVTKSFYEAIDNIRKRIQQDIAKGGENLPEIYQEARLTLEPIIRNFVVRNTRQSIGQIERPDGTIQVFPDMKVSNSPYIPSKIKAEISDTHKIITQFPVKKLADTMDTLLHPIRQISDFKGLETIETKNQTLVYNIYQLILGLSFVPYRWRMYDFRFYGKTRQEIKEIRMSGKEQQQIAMQLSLYGIMRVLFLKRLESSAHALEVSLARYKKRLEFFEQVLRDENIIINLSDIDDIADEYAEDDGDQVVYSTEELLELARKKPEEVDNNFNKEILLDDIHIEKNLIDEIISLVQNLKKEDPKIFDLKNKLRETRKNDPNKKLLIFTFFADTIDYIQQELENDPEFTELFKESAFVSGRDRKHALHCAERFAPIAKDAQELAAKEGELTYLFATDVLSEGQNLQDCGAIINYDLHWNPVRMVQRNGRINRLGSDHSVVTVENFVPGDDLEKFLGLMQRLQNKINLIKHAIGTETTLFGEDIDPRSYTDLYNEDGEVATESYEQLEASLNAFSDDVFLRDLMNFYKTATDEEIRQMERIPLGSWGIIPNGLEKPNDVLLLSQLGYESGLSKFVFFGNSADANSIGLIQNTLALNMIRSNNIEKQKDILSINKEEQLNAMVRRGPQIARDNIVDQSLTPTKETVLNEARTYSWTAEDMDKLRATLTTRNVNLGRKVSRLVRSINSAIKENISAEELYKKLRELLVEPTEQPAITQTKFLLGYTDQYKT